MLAQCIYSKCLQPSRGNSRSSIKLAESNSSIELRDLNKKKHNSINMVLVLFTDTVFEISGNDY